MAQSAADNPTVRPGVPSQFGMKKQSDIPVGQDFKNVQRVIESDPTLRKLAGAPTFQTKFASGEKIMYSAEAEQVAQALIEEGKKPGRASPRAVMRTAGRLIREKRFGLTSNEPGAAPAAPTTAVSPQNVAKKPVPSSGDVQTSGADGGGAESGTASTASPTTCAPTSTTGAVTDQIEIKHGDAKGVYAVHPVARMFPLLTGKPFDDLKKSIEIYGQQDPIIVDAHTILDGRNRLIIMNELGREPKLVQFATLKTGIPAPEWIAVKNLQRRHLTDDQRLAIATEYQAWVRQEQARQAAKTGTTKPAAQGESAKGGGAETDAKPSQTAENAGGSEYPPNSAENAAKPKRGRPRGGRSDAEAAAARTNQSRYRAEWMFKLQKQAPALFKAVEDNRLTLKAAIKQFKAQQPLKKPRTHIVSTRDKVKKAVQWAEQLLAQRCLKLLKVERSVFWNEIATLAARRAEIENA